jgi:hypothetical protein
MQSPLPRHASCRGHGWGSRSAVASPICPVTILFQKISEGSRERGKRLGSLCIWRLLQQVSQQEGASGRENCLQDVLRNQLLLWALGYHPASFGQNVLPQSNEIAQDPSLWAPAASHGDVAGSPAVYTAEYPLTR